MHVGDRKGDERELEARAYRRERRPEAAGMPAEGEQKEDVLGRLEADSRNRGDRDDIPTAVSRRRPAPRAKSQVATAASAKKLP